jgi:hypothetical protein
LGPRADQLLEEDLRQHPQRCSPDRRATPDAEPTPLHIADAGWINDQAVTRHAEAVDLNANESPPVLAVEQLGTPALEPAGAVLCLFLHTFGCTPVEKRDAISKRFLYAARQVFSAGCQAWTAETSTARRKKDWTARC